MTEETELAGALERAITLASRLDPRTASADDEIALAEALIDVRSHVLTRFGTPDWHARTSDAKSMAAEIYSAVKTDEDSLRKLKRRMRYHIYRIVPDRMAEDPIEDGNDVFYAESFYDDLGIFIKNLGRRSTTDTEAAQLALAAGKLMDLIDEEAVHDENPVSRATVLAALQAVSDSALAIHKRLNTQ